MSILTVLTLIFVVLKLTNHIDWSWFYVLMPTIIFCVLWTVYFIYEETLTKEEKFIREMKRKYKI